MLQFSGDNGTCSGGKAVLTGTPIRAELLSGDASRAFALCNFTDSAKPTLLVVGGSSGSRAINTAIRDLLPELIKNYNVIHLCGKGNVDASLNAIAGYAQFEYANEELADLFALSSLSSPAPEPTRSASFSHCANRIS